MIALAAKNAASTMNNRVVRDESEADILLGSPRMDPPGQDTRALRPAVSPGA